MRSVGVVGARAATAYGERVAADLAFGLAGRGFAIVSGGAFGIDASAHRGALGGGGPTYLISAGGLDAPYPPANAALFERCADSGLLISESPPGAAPQRRRFLTRNRLIAALSTGTVVVEASTRSGAVNTAGHCIRLDRPLMVVPGPVTSAMSAGCHELLQRYEGYARMVTSVQDVVGIVGGLLETADQTPAATGRGNGLQQRLDELDESARALFDSTRRAPVPAPTNSSRFPESRSARCWRRFRCWSSPDWYRPPATDTASCVWRTGAGLATLARAGHDRERYPTPAGTRLVTRLTRAVGYRSPRVVTRLTGRSFAVAAGSRRPGSRSLFRECESGRGG